LLEEEEEAEEETAFVEILLEEVVACCCFFPGEPVRIDSAEVSFKMGLFLLFALPEGLLDGAAGIVLSERETEPKEIERV
jgi:hypothetical protein